MAARRAFHSGIRPFGASKYGSHKMHLNGDNIDAVAFKLYKPRSRAGQRLAKACRPVSHVFRCFVSTSDRVTSVVLVTVVWRPQGRIRTQGAKVTCPDSNYCLLHVSQQLHES